MAPRNPIPIVLPEHFILAIRDAGYKGLGSAIAEMIDNAFEAEADNISISICRVRKPGNSDAIISIADDGIGMDSKTLEKSLQFGWSSRFNRRDGVGRYGMGLPNASLSQARRVEVISSTDGKSAHIVHLDIDELIPNPGKGMRPVRKTSYLSYAASSPYKKGTFIRWTNCDRIDTRNLDGLCNKLIIELGRIFRYQLWGGKR